MRASTLKITTLGIDCAMTVFQMHGVDARGKVLLRGQLHREQVAAHPVHLPPRLIGMESDSRQAVDSGPDRR